jgi:hypothetical protein
MIGKKITSGTTGIKINKTSMRVKTNNEPISNDFFKLNPIQKLNTNNQS